MFCTILLQLLLPFTSAQTLHENKTKWRVAPKRKTGAAAKHSLKQTAQRRSHRLIEPSNHWTKNQKSQIAQEYGLLPADARQQKLNKKELPLREQWILNYVNFLACILFASDWFKNNQLLSKLTQAHYCDTVALTQSKYAFVSFNDRLRAVSLFLQIK